MIFLYTVIFKEIFVELNYIIIRFYNEIHAFANSNIILISWIFAWKI